MRPRASTSMLVGLNSCGVCAQSVTSIPSGTTNWLVRSFSVGIGAGAVVGGETGRADGESDVDGSALRAAQALNNIRGTENSVRARYMGRSYTRRRARLSLAPRDAYHAAAHARRPATGAGVRDAATHVRDARRDG